MQQKQRQRIQRISKQLNKLNKLIEYSKYESIQAFKALQNYKNNQFSSQQQSYQQNNYHNRSELSNLLDENDSYDTIQIHTKKIADQFYENRSLQISRPGQFINHSYHEDNSKYNNFNNDMHQSNISSQFKQSVIEISEIKHVDTTIKKQKLLKTNVNKNKKNLFQKQRVLSKNNEQKINRIKSQNKLLSSNPSNFKRGINIIKQQMSLKKQNEQKDKKQKGKGLYHIQQNIQKNYISDKLQTLNSKRNIKYNSINKNQKEKEKIQKQKQKNSKNKFHLNLQKEVTMKITDLKIKKNLCQIQTSYLSASVKITKQQISRIDDISTQYSDETLLKYFILKSIIKFISQYNDETWTNSEDIEINNQMVTKTLKKPQKFIKIINKLPDILRRRNIVSQYICKDFIQQKSFIQQKLNNLPGVKLFQKQPLYIYLCQLHLYIEFLLNNSMIHQTKRNKIFNPTSEEFFSDRSTKEMKLTVNVPKQTKFIQSKKKQYSQRKKPATAILKRVNTSKALKKSVNTNNSSKLKRI